MPKINKIHKTPPGRNIIINSNFDFWQRGNLVQITSGTRKYTADRWFAWRSANDGDFDVSRQTGDPPTGSNFYARFQRNNAATTTSDVAWGYASEATDAIKMRGKEVTIQFYARAGAAFSAAGSALQYNFATNVSQARADFGGTPFATGSVTLTTSWQRFTVKATIPTSGVEGLGFRWFFTPVGTAGGSDYVEMAQISVREGDAEGEAYERYGKTLEEELAAALRYYQLVQFAMGTATDPGNAQVVMTHKVEMRTAPSLATPSSAIRVTDMSTADYVQSSPQANIVNITATGGRIALSNFSGMTTNRPTAFISGGGTLNFDAEL